jgi:hypothetical protein
MLIIHVHPDLKEMSEACTKISGSTYFDEVVATWVGPVGPGSIIYGVINEII